MSRTWLIVWLTAVWTFVGAVWWTHRGTPSPEHDHALSLDKLIAKVADPPTSEWLIGFGSGVTEAENAGDAGCGACHANERADWAASRHAGESPAFVACGGCHQHEGTIYGANASPAAAPHATLSREEFRSPAFCARCHDAKGDKTLAGKRITETTQEWLRTDAAAAGKTCISCHMPNGRHLWKGVYDKEMVAGAITANVRFMTQGTDVAGKFSMTNTGAGHRLPTTAGPELVMSIDQLDSTALPIAGTHAEAIVGRRLDDAATIELFDTRLLPGEVKVLPYIAALHPDARAFRARVECRPAEGERRRLAWADEDARELAATLATRFTAWEEIVRLPAE